MGINIGSTAISDLKLGSTQVDKVYLGSTEVWSAGGAEDPTTWVGIQQIVRNGHASNYFSVGDEINVSCPWTDPSSGTTYDWVWIVADLGTAYKESDPNTAVPAMTLIAKYIAPNSYRFDAAEKEVATEQTAADGVYYYGYNGSTYTKLPLATGDPIPYGDYTTIYKNSVNMTSGYEVQSGYNNWEFSNIRQWLNSSAAANAWFTPAHVGDSAPNYTNQAGFLSGFSSDFLSSIASTRSGTASNTVTDGGASYYTYDKMFLPSQYEVKLDTSLTDEGPVFALYANAVDADRVKYRLDRTTSTSYWLLRSINRGTANVVYSVTNAGNSTWGYSYGSFPFAPACRIC